MAFASWTLNGYEALINAIAANVVLALRSKKMPGMDTMLKFGLEKAVINIAGSYLANYIPMEGVNPLDIEYLSQALAAAIASNWKPGTTASYQAMEQMMISLVSHLIATKSSSAALPFINKNLGNVGVESINPSSSLY
jgi:hypothetical protein